MHVELSKKQSSEGGGEPAVIKSILKTSEKNKEQRKSGVKLERRDSSGALIGGKQDKFKLVFRDKCKTAPSKTIADIHYVESYKKYNLTDYEEETIICKCSIF